jgi:tetratricopeptide (TPR) repeat protein
MSLKPSIYKSQFHSMRLKALIISIIMMPVLACPADLHGQKQVQPTRQLALEAFSSGNYSEAFSAFSDLLVTYPRDPLYKFYAGASLVELGRDPVTASDLLKQAIDAASFKTLPPDAFFYLGRAEQMQGNFDEAIRAYNRFGVEAGRRASRQRNVEDYIQQSRNRQGRIQAQTIVAQTPADEKKEPNPPAAKRNESLPPAVEKNMGETLEKQFRSDSIARAAAGAKTAQQRQVTPVKEPVQQNMPEKAAVQQKPSAADSNITDAKEMQPPAAQVNLKQLTGNQSGVFSVFEVLPEPVTDPRIQVTINPEIPEGLIYRIQIAVFRNPVAISFFKGLSPIYGFKAEGSTSVTYYAGMFRRAADANKALSSVRAKGFRDSFVASLMNGKRVSAERAAVLEEEWGNKPLFSISASKDPALDTIPPALVFSVEVARSKQPLSKETVNGYVKTAGNRGLDVRQLEDGNFVYLIGNFITFESADEYAALLVRNGFRDAKVTAWLGRRELDVKTAKELFENLQ